MKKILVILLAALFMMLAFVGCSSNEGTAHTDIDNVPSNDTGEKDKLKPIVLTDEIIELSDGLSAVQYTGDYGFDLFLEQGGASSDSEVVSFLTDNVMSDLGSLIFGGNPFGCSTFGSNIHFRLAFRQLLSGKSRYIGAFVVALLLVFFASLVGRMDSWLGSDGKGMMDAFNPADHDIGVQSFGELTQEEFERTILQYTDITDTYVLAMPTTTLNGISYTANVIPI